MILHLFNGFFSRTTWVSRHQKVKPFWILMKQEMMGGNDIRWTICKSFAYHTRQIAMPIPHHCFYRPDTLPAAQSTASKHFLEYDDSDV